MANTKSALKAIRVSARKAARNRPVRSALRTYVKKAVTSIQTTGDNENTVASLREAMRQLDKAASKGIIHKNNAARRKSRLAAKYAKITASTTQTATKA